MNSKALRYFSIDTNKLRYENIEKTFYKLRIILISSKSNAPTMLWNQENVRDGYAISKTWKVLLPKNFQYAENKDPLMITYHYNILNTDAILSVLVYHILQPHKF